MRRFINGERRVVRPNIDRAWLRQRLLFAQLIAAPIGLVVLAWLLVDELPLARISENVVGVSAGVLIGLAGLQVFGARLHLVARLFGLAIARRAVWRVHIVSLFYYFFLPAGVGYDLVRVAKLGASATAGRPGGRLPASGRSSALPAVSGWWCCFCSRCRSPNSPTTRRFPCYRCR